MFSFLETQFVRCLSQTLSISLSQEEQKILCEKYDFRRDKTFNYRAFCSNIEKLMMEKLESQIQEEITSEQPVEETAPDVLKTDIISKLASYCTIYGLSIKSSFQDFDPLCKGTVSESQFYRNLPKPPNTNEVDYKHLVDMYMESHESNYVNYYKLDNDVRICQQLKEDLPYNNSIEPIRPEKLEECDNPINKVINNIKVEAFKKGIRTTDFFKDYDKLNCGAITESQFITSLKLGIGKEANLTMDDIQKIVESNRTVDGKVRYKEFCEDIENAFTCSQLEKKPFVDVQPPVMGSLNRKLNDLSNEEEAVLEELLKYHSDKVKEGNLLIFPYFKDFDRSSGYTKSVTKSQFSRVMHFIKIDITESQLNLLAKKFGNEKGDICYPLYVQSVDPDFKSHYIGDFLLPNPPEIEVKPAAIPEANLDDIMSRIRHVVFVNRLHVGQNFEDYDPLRTGSITKAQFRRGLSSLGFSMIGFHDITEAQFDLLCNNYQDPNEQNKVLWLNFDRDINIVFTTSSLEKNPTEEVRPSSVYIIPKSGTVDWNKATNEQKEVLNTAMKKIRKYVKEKRIFIEPCFRDFDSLNNHHITRKQFKQCLSIMNIPFNNKETDAIMARFCNDIGFNYMTFLYELLSDEYALSPPRYCTLKKEILERKAKKLSEAPPVNVSEETVLTKIKNKVFKERFRLIDYMKDYDKLNSGRIIKSNFERAIGLSPLNLNESEMAFLKTRFSSRNNPENVDYRKFCEEIESIFTVPNLEKFPQQEVEQYQPKNEWETNSLTQEEEAEFMDGMSRIAKKVREDRIQLFPLMEDYDKLNIGSLSHSQFRRVLVELSLGSYFSDKELNTICKKFRVQVGYSDNVHYIGFCDFIYELGKFIYRTP
ncbi:Hypothetical predicted protein [Argonauta hians]